MKVLGILNITEDSFFDGGRFFEKEKAIEQAEKLIRDGTYGIDLGAQSSNVNAKIISPDLEWERLKPVISTLKERNVVLSVDTYKPAVIEKCIQARVDFINDITSFSNPESMEILQEYKTNLPELIIMFSHNGGQIAQVKSHLRPESIVSEILDFFDTKMESLIKIGVPKEKIIIDPGMGFFLGEDPILSFQVLKNISQFQKRFGRVLVSVSNKSFLGNILGGLKPSDRSSATLTAEIYLYSQNIEFIRTHNCLQIEQAKAIWDAILL